MHPDESFLSEPPNLNPVPAVSVGAVDAAVTPNLNPDEGVSVVEEPAPNLKPDEVTVPATAPKPEAALKCDIFIIQCFDIMSTMSSIVLLLKFGSCLKVQFNFNSSPSKPRR